LNPQTPQELLARINALIDNPDIVMHQVALAVLPELRHRVHVEGKDSAGNRIGTYSPEYMKLRTGNYGNAGRISRGPNKGKLKDAGKFTKGLNIKIRGTIVEDSPKKGLARPQYHRDADPKVILSLTRQMENDLSVIETPTGYAIGYLNDFNYQKAIWCEETYKKPILTQLTADELAYAEKAAGIAIDDYLNDTKTTT